jgi:hypothetical protein
MDAFEYEMSLRLLAQAGQEHPPGRLLHLCTGHGERLQITSVWEHAEDLVAFRNTLLPVVEEIGLDVGVPELKQVHKLIRG